MRNRVDGVVNFISSLTYHLACSTQAFSIKPISMQPIITEDDIRSGLTALISADPRLREIADVAGPVPLRRRKADFEGLAQIITGQQVSVASATAIFARLQSLVSPLTVPQLEQFSDEDLAGVGLSRPKIRTLRAVCMSCQNGLDLGQLANIPAREAHEQLCEIKGIGRWTADVFLLFCVGHPDVFPSGDLALQVAVRDALTLEDKPSQKDLDVLASDWAPHRAIAARLFWAWYRVQKQGRETMPA
ncbi:DNA-3-methyladenine glycosylase [Roseibium album]|nr:DNA-3-methyladenine glycosylase [Roseibium album]